MQSDQSRVKLGVSLPVFIVDAFTGQPFSGNPAAVCLVEGRQVRAQVRSPTTTLILCPTLSHLPSPPVAVRWAGYSRPGEAEHSSGVQSLGDGDRDQDPARRRVRHWFQVQPPLVHTHQRGPPLWACHRRSRCRPLLLLQYARPIL